MPFRPSRKQVVEYYKAHRSKFRVAEQIHLLQIVKTLDGTADRAAALASIEAAANELRAGHPFGQVADRYSDCAGNGGELGWVERGVMVEEFENVVFELPLGKVSSVFETRFGFHIALATQKRGPGTLPLGAVYEDIERLLLGKVGCR